MKFKNETFLSHGIIVEKTPTISKGKKRISTYEIEGRNGFLSIDSNTYEPFVVSVECHAKAGADFDDIKSFLDGYGKVSFENGRFYNAIIQNAIPFSKVHIFKKFIVEFLCNPIAYSEELFEQSVNSSPFTFSILGSNVEIEPLITLKGSGNVQLAVNNNALGLLNLSSSRTYTLNCEAKTIVDNLGNNCSSKMSGFFLTLDNVNTVEYVGNVTQLKFEYRKAYL